MPVGCCMVGMAVGLCVERVRARQNWSTQGVQLHGKPRDFPGPIPNLFVEGAGKGVRARACMCIIIRAPTHPLQTTRRRPTAAGSQPGQAAQTLGLWAIPACSHLAPRSSANGSGRLAATCDSTSLLGPLAGAITTTKSKCWRHRSIVGPSSAGLQDPKSPRS